MSLSGYLCMPEDKSATEDPRPKPRFKGSKKQKLQQIRKEYKLRKAQERKAAKQEAKRQKREDRQSAKALKKGKPPEKAEEPENEPEARERREPRRERDPKKEPEPKKLPKAKKSKKSKKPKNEKKGKKGKKSKKEGKGGKKGKMPVMIALGVVLLGGGFFGFKMVGGGGEQEPPPIKLGDATHVLNLGEFLVNTSDGKTFLRATIGVHLADGTALFHVEGGGHGSSEPGFEMTAPYTDAVRAVLRRQTLRQLMSEDGERAIKIQIAAAVNEVYGRSNHEEEDGHDEEAAEGEHPEDEHAEEEPEIIDESWHSQTGPVLIVYLTDYVWE